MTIPEIILDIEGREFVLIRHAYDDGFTTMPKAIYDAQVKVSTEIPTDGAN